MRLCLIFGLWAALTLCASLAAAQDGPVRPAGYVPEPEIEALIQQALDLDKAVSQKAVGRLTQKGPSAERAVQWHLAKENAPVACLKWADLYARCDFGRVGFRTCVELQPDGSGIVTLWSDRSAIAECGKRYERLHGRPEPVYDDEELRRNPFSKVELLKHMPDGVKYLEGGVQPNKEGRIEARGVLSFKNFEAFAQFAESFDPGGIYLLAGSSLTDAKGGPRVFRYRKARETDLGRIQENMLLFHGVRWQYELDIKGRVLSNNAPSTSGSTLIWRFNCYQMMRAEALVEAGYDNTGLAARPAGNSDEGAQPIPNVAQDGQPVAVVRQREMRVKLYTPLPDGGKPALDDLRKSGQLVELDGSQSLPGGDQMTFQWVQTLGNDLNLSKEALSKKIVYLIITKDPGEYRFELRVTHHNATSKPVEVRVTVEDGRAAAKPEAPKDVVKDAPKEAPKEIVKESPKETPKETPKEAAKPEVETPKAADPARAKELHAQGMVEFKASRLAEARKLLAEASALNPDEMEIKFDLAVTLMDLYSKALSDATGEKELREALNAKEIREALALFEDVAEKTRNARAYMNVGHCYSRMNNLGQARTAYIAGSKLGKEQVAWENVWQLGNKKLAAKEYESALNLLKEAEDKAGAAKVTDYRLLRDMAIALQGCKQSGEALKRLDAYQKLGYTPEPSFLAEVKKQAAGGGETAKPPAEPSKPQEPPAKPDVAGVTPKVKDKPKPKETRPADPVKVATDTPPENQEPAKPVEPKKADPAPARVPAKKADFEPATPRKPKPAAPKRALPPIPADFDGALAAGRRALDAGSVAAKALVEAKNKSAQDFDDAEMLLRAAWGFKPGEAQVSAAFQELANHTGPITLAADAGVKPKPVVSKRPSLPIPADFDGALAAGRRALDSGSEVLKASDEARIKSAQDFEEAEAMLRAARVYQPGEARLIAAFQELANHTGAVALVASSSVKAKPNGLVVLNAESSVGPKDKPLYFSWRQVDGEDLGLRPEQLADKKIGLRIPKAGVYKFDVAVSDGIKGGSPVSVVVEVLDIAVDQK
jgi:tetratricopeptide (TPR) repeat protein